MKKTNITIAIFAFMCLQTNLFADIAPNPIKAKTLGTKNPTSIRMESEKVVIDLYNDSSVVRCSFNMKNLGENEKLKIGFPEMSFYYFDMSNAANDIHQFKVKENGKAIKFGYTDSLKYNEYFKKVESYEKTENWYLWDSEFQKGESKTIEVQYSLPYGALYKTNKRFFTYLLSTGANWKGTIGKAEIIVNLKDIVQDSIISKNPANCEVSNNQLIWTFSELEPTTNDDIKIIYNSNKILYTGLKQMQPVVVMDGKIVADMNSAPVSEIASIEVFKDSKNNMKYPNAKNGIIEIYTKKYIVDKLERIIQAKTKKKIALPEFSLLMKSYVLLINDKEVSISKISNIDEKSIATLELLNAKDQKSKIIIKLKD